MARPERDFRLLQKILCFKQCKCEIALSCTREPYFCDVAPLQKYVKKKTEFWEIAYCHVNMHFFLDDGPKTVKISPL